jgi:hypothetical protein
MIESTPNQDPLVARAHRRLEWFRARGVHFVILLPRGVCKFFRTGQLRDALRLAKRYGDAEVLETAAASTRDEFTKWALACAVAPKGLN